MKEVPGLYLFLSHTQIFKERSNQRLEINIHAPFQSLGVECSFLSFQTEAVSGGAKRDRTADLLRARQALSQLSYGPVFLHTVEASTLTSYLTSKLVGLGRFELPTSPLSGVRSNQLSYRPKIGCAKQKLLLIVFFNESSNSCGCLWCS